MPRISLSAVAAELGVSAMTVSRALRGRPGVSEALRARIRATAARLGYRPDPEIGKLMHHLRRGTKAGLRANLCAVTDYPEGAESGYCTRLHRHACERARELGFAFSVLRVKPGRRGWGAAFRAIAARGVEGVLLLPLVEPTALAPEGWERLSVVSATSSVTAPRFHEVAPNHSANARLLIDRLVGRGFQRLGFVGRTSHSRRTRDAFPAALAWHHSQSGLRCAPLLYPSETPPSLRAWLRRERPDMVIVGHPPDLSVFEEDLRLAGMAERRVLANSRPFELSAPGLDERSDLIGSVAIDTLASLVMRGERGIPAVPSSISITGEWSGLGAIGQR